VRVDILENEMPIEVYERYADYNRRNPIDDQTNHHYPIAQLSALLYNINRGNSRAKKMTDFLVIPPEDNRHIDDVLANDDW
jgi:hypothetical protein